MMEKKFLVIKQKFEEQKQNLGITAISQSWVEAPFRGSPWQKPPCKQKTRLAVYLLTSSKNALR